MERIRTIKLNKGSSEFMAFAIIAPMICFIIIELCAYVQLSSDIHEITNALDIAGRSAVTCQNIDDAVALSQMMAEASIANSKIENISTSVEYVTTEENWKTGVLIKVILEADVKTFSFIQKAFSMTDNSVHISRSMVYAIEGNSVQLYLSDDERTLLARIIGGEAGTGDSFTRGPLSSSSYEVPTGYPGCMDKVMVGSVLINRVESSRFPDTYMACVYQAGQYACTNSGGNSGFNNPTAEDYAVADWLIENGSQLPSDVLGQSASVQGAGEFGRVVNPAPQNTHIYSVMY